MELTAVLGFAAIAATLIAVPGPDWAYVLAAGTNGRVVVPAVGGLLAGYAVIAAVVAAGVGSLVATVPAVLTLLTVCGASYLIYLGTRTLRSAATIARDESGSRASSTGSYVLRGMGVSGLNPKGLLIFLSILPQFADSSGPWPMAAQLMTLGGVFVAIAAVFYVPLGFAADRVLSARPLAARVTTKVAGVAMIVVGLALAIERTLLIVN